MMHHKLKYLIAAATLVAASSASAAINKAATGTDLTAVASWSGGVAPGVNDQANWITTSNTGSFTLGATGTTSVDYDRLWFGTTAGDNIGGSSAAITLGNLSDSATITLSSVTTSAAGTYNLVNNSTNAVTINNAIIGTGTGDIVTPFTPPANRSLTFSVGSTGGLTVANSVTALGTAAANDGSLMLRGAGAGLGTITGNLNIDGAVVKSDISTWVLSGSNSMQFTQVQGGTLRLGSDNALGGSAIDLGTANAVTVSSDGTTARTFTSAMNLGSTGVITLGNATNNGALTFGSLTLATVTGTGAVGARTLKLDSDVTFTGGLLGAGATTFTKQGSGTLTLNGTGAASISGLTTISTGTVLANGTTTFGTAGGGTISVSSGATLGGTGSLGRAATVLGNITGGTAADVGTLTTNALTLGATGVYLAQIDSTMLTADKLAVTGALALTAGSTLTLTDLGLFSRTGGEILTIATATGGITGTFNGVANGQVLSVGSNQWQIGYGANDITLTAVPEPSTYGLLGAVALAAVALVRRRRKAAPPVA